MDPESLESAEQTLRRSARANKGKEPPRYGASETTSVVGSTASSTSALRRKRLEAELALQRRQAELTAQIVEQQRALATAEHDLRQAEIDEEEEETLLRSGDEAYSHKDLHTDSRSSRTAQWVNNVSSKNPPQPISVSRQPAAETATMTTAEDAPAPASESALDADAGPGASLSAPDQPAVDQDTHAGASSLAETTVSTTHRESDKLAHVTMSTSNPMNTVTIDSIHTYMHTSVGSPVSPGMSMSTHDTLTTSSHPPMNAQISQPTLAVSLPALAPTMATCAPQRAAPQSAPQPATTSFSLSLSSSPQHVTYQNALPPAAVLTIMTHVHAPSVTTSAPLQVVAQPQQTRSVHVPHTSGRVLGPLTNTTQPAVQTSTSVGSYATRVGSQLPSMSVASQPPVTHPTAATFPPSASSTMHLHVPQQRSHTTTDDALTRLADTLSSVLQPRPAEQAAFTQYMARQTQGNQLPSFSSSPEEWPVFKALYDSSTTACGFTNADNLARLQRCLKGTAKDMVLALLS